MPPAYALPALLACLVACTVESTDPATDPTVATSDDPDASSESTAADPDTATETSATPSTSATTDETTASTDDTTTDDTTTTGDPAPGCNTTPSIIGTTNDGYTHATSFPITFTFDDDLYATTQSAIWANADAGAQHEHLPTGGWNGCGAARFYPPSLSENMSGIGQILSLRNVTETPTLAIRYCISAGATFPELSSGAKPIILWRADPDTDIQVHDDAVGARPMVISRPDPNNRGITYGLCDGTVCTYHGGDFWPDGSDTWVLDDSGWSCLEFDFDLANDSMQLFVTTRDGRFDDTPYLSATFRDESSGPGGVFSAIDIVGGYFAQAASDPDNYYVIDDLVIDTAHVGPPPGFAR